MNFYEVLGVNVDASEAEIRKSYQELARKYHPDKSTDAASNENFVKLTEAWQVLGDARRRKEYDDQLKREELYQKYPISEELFIEDLEYKSEKEVYNHSCRCGGLYEISTETAQSAKDKEIAIKVLDIMERSKSGRWLSCQKKQAKGKTSRMSKTGSKISLRLLPWETKYQHTLFHYVDKNRQKKTDIDAEHRIQKDFNDQNQTSHYQFEKLGNTTKNRMSTSLEKKFPSDIEITPTRVIQDSKEEFGIPKKEANENSEHEMKNCCRVKSKFEMKKCFGIKSKWYDTSFVEKIHCLNDLNAVPVGLQLKVLRNNHAEFIQAHIGENKVDWHSLSRFESAFESGSFCYKTSYLDRLFSYNPNECIPSVKFLCHIH